MGAVAAVRILHRRRLAEVSPEIRPQVEAELAAEHERIAGGVDKAVEIGVVDEVVDPARTRSAIAEAIDAAVQAGGVRRGHHGNIPLCSTPTDRMGSGRARVCVTPARSVTLS